MALVSDILVSFQCSPCMHFFPPLNYVPDFVTNRLSFFHFVSPDERWGCLCHLPAAASSPGRGGALWAGKSLGGKSHACTKCRRTSACSFTSNRPRTIVQWH
eukprot:GHVT01102670.1.p1 GENE.GHVT01102670.1~~GHVT01102670.1.p1  ORF type:complete len:102 (+),score=1.81 GHVT01102670.1:1297-1602(+)